MKRIILILAIAPLFSFGQEVDSWIYKTGKDLIKNPVNVSRLEGSFNYLHNRDTFSYEVDWVNYGVKPGKQFGLTTLVKYNSLGKTYEGLDYGMFEMLAGLAWFPWKKGSRTQLATSFMVGFNAYESEIVSVDTVGYFDIETTSREIKGLTSLTLRVLGSMSIHEKFFVEHSHDLQMFFLRDYPADHWFLIKATYRKGGLEAGVMYEHLKGGGVTLSYRFQAFKLLGIAVGSNILFWDKAIPNSIQPYIRLTFV